MGTFNHAEQFKITGDWAVQSKSLKERFNHLTDSDLRLEPGKDSEMLGRMQQRLKRSREEVIAIIRSSARESEHKNAPKTGPGIEPKTESKPDNTDGEKK
jgi:hypothetical protein